MPKPVPPKRREIERSSCEKGLNRSTRNSGDMPLPVSDSTNATCRTPSETCMSRSDSVMVPPGLVNFCEFESRFVMTCVRRSSSPMT